jgi:hypothetical protein
MVVNEVVITLECFCCFHKLCINTWFAKDHACPNHKTLYGQPPKDRTSSSSSGSSSDS